MKQLLKYTIIAYIIGTTLIAQAQNTYPIGDTLLSEITAARIEPKTIRLRWVPRNYTTWKYVHEFGYVLTRYTMGIQGEIWPPEKIKENKKQWEIHPRPKEELQELAAAAGKYWAIAYAAYYAPTFEATSNISSIVQANNITKERENRYGFSLFACDQDFAVAKDYAFAFEDQEEVEENFRYLYVLTPLGEAEGLIKADASVKVAEENVFVPTLFARPSAEAGDKSVFITCPLPKPYNPYVSYFVQRSSDGTTFVNRNNEPLINTNAENEVENTITFADDLPQNNVQYYYRVYGMSHFGIQSPMSEAVTVIGKPKPLEYTPYILDILPINNTFQVKWEFPDAQNAQINGFEIWRSRFRDETPIKIASAVAANLRQYTDNQPMTENYYRVIALDKNGYNLESLPKLAQLKDETPPSAPKGLNGKVEKTGEVTLTWNANNESDLQGYRVFACNRIDGEYSEITRYWIKETTFRLKTNLNTLAEKLYYKVCALDYHENQSKPSEPLTLSIPDIIAPVRPVLISLTAKTNGTQIDWETSSSEDVVQHEIQRKLTYEVAFTTIATFTPKMKFSKTYIDSTTALMADYDYRIQATDDAGLTTVSAIQSIQAIGAGFRPDIAFPDAIYDLISFQNPKVVPIKQSTGVGRNIVKLSWYYGSQFSNVQEFFIYRSIGQNVKGGKFVGRTILWKAFTPQQCLYTGKAPSVTIITPPDANISTTPNQTPSAGIKGMNYYLIEDDDINLINQTPRGELHYQVLVKYDDGSTSRMSPLITTH
jgi:uncharacterized protein